MERLQPILGLVVMIGLLYLWGADPRAASWRVVVWGLGRGGEKM